MEAPKPGSAGDGVNSYGVMFHHFHDSRHPRGQGAISGEQLDRIIQFLERKNILDAEEWMALALKGTLPPGVFCLTFDDNLRCQYDIAYPVLQRHRIRAFWFIYTSVFDGKPEKLEVYRYFRTVSFASPESFYDAFFEVVGKSEHGRKVESALNGFDPQTYLQAYPFYTIRDKQFRFVRDRVLGGVHYDDVMSEMLRVSGFSTKDLLKKLWMDEACLRSLHAEGHVLGLHSHSHPTLLEALAARAAKDGI